MGSSKADEVASRKYFQENGTLHNKLDIKKAPALEKAEAFFVEQAKHESLSPRAKEINTDGLKQMHKKFFGDVYTWAGEFRDYTTGRGVPFCRPEFIENELNKIYDKVNWSLSPDMPQENFCKVAAEFIGDLNAIHPFVDGNGRTQRQVLSLLAEKANLIINHTTLNQEEWYKAAEVSHLMADYRLFEQLIDKATNREKSLG